MMGIRLGNILGLRPLDRLQVNNAFEIREMRMAPQLGYGQLDLPFMYFQRVCANGLLEVRSPGGYVTRVRPEDVCDVLPGEQVTIRAMPHQIFLERLKLHHSKKLEPAGEECYAEANVMYVVKDGWGRVDQVFASFVDDSLNTENSMGSAVCTPIHLADRVMIEQVSRRNRMPVMGKGNSSYSADSGVDREQELNRDLVSGFIRLSLRNNPDEKIAVDALSEVGAGSLNRAAIKRLRRYSDKGRWVGMAIHERGASNA